MRPRVPFPGPTRDPRPRTGAVVRPRCSRFAGILLAVLAVAPVAAQETAVRFNHYATVEAKIVGLRDGGRWICPGEAVGICDFERAGLPAEADLVGSVASFSYDRDGFGQGRLGEVRVDIEQPSIFNPFAITNRVTSWEFRASRWKEFVLGSLREGFRTDELVVDDTTTVDATLWFLHLPIQVQLAWRNDPGLFRRNELADAYGRITVLIRLEPQTDRSVFIREAARDTARFRLDGLYMGPHAVEAAAVTHWGRLGPDVPGTTGLRWNAGGERALAHDPETVWGYPLAAEERARIGGDGEGAELPGLGRARSWFNRPVYFTVELTRLEATRQDVPQPGGGTERQWVGDQAYVDAAIHTYVIGEWTNRPVEVAEGASQGPVRADARDWRSRLDAFFSWIPQGFRSLVLWGALAAVALALVLSLLPRVSYNVGAGIRSFWRGLRGRER